MCVCVCVKTTYSTKYFLKYEYHLSSCFYFIFIYFNIKFNNIKNYLLLMYFIFLNKKIFIYIIAKIKFAKISNIMCTYNYIIYYIVSYVVVRFLPRLYNSSSPSSLLLLSLSSLFFTQLLLLLFDLPPVTITLLSLSIT